MNTVTVSRYEYKYLVAPAALDDIRHYLLRYCDPDKHSNGAAWYTISSLYLDTPDYRFYRLSAGQALERIKLRARAYAMGGPVKLEIKRRAGDLITKHSLVITPETWQRLARAGARALPHGANGAPVDFARLTEGFRAAPKLLVHYERQAFHSNVDDYVRVTFDRRIRCQPMRAWSFDGGPRAWGPVDAGVENSPYVLEVKFILRPPAWLHDMVTALRLVRRGFSKYARGVRRTLGEREPAWDLRAWRAA